MSFKPRILHSPHNIGNYPWILSRAERELGFQSDLSIFKSHIYYNNYDKILNINYFSIPGEIKKINFFKKAIKNYDIFHFNWGFSILDYPYLGLDYLDFAFLKRAGKKIFMTLQGDDVRQKDYFQAHFGYGPYPAPTYSFKDWLMDRRRQVRIKKIDKFADKIFALNPDLLYVLPSRAKFIPYPYPVEKIKNILPCRQSSKIKIVHAPSHRFAKGTDLIIKVINRLKKKYPIDFVLVENLKQDQAQKVYKGADLAIDQLIVGWYGIFAVEMMAMGIPVIAFLRQNDLKKFVPFWKEIPIINTNAETLQKKLEIFIKDPSLRKKIGKQGQKFVMKNHHSLKIAKEISQYY